MAITQKGLLTRVTGPLGRTAGGPGIYAWLVAITCAFVNNCPMQTDEGIFHYAGWLWVHKGLPPYVGVVENKGPAIFIVNAISNVLFGVNIWFTRLLGCLFLVGTSWLLYLIGRRLAGKTAGTLAMITFGLAMSWASMNGWVCLSPKTSCSASLCWRFTACLSQKTPLPRAGAVWRSLPQDYQWGWLLRSSRLLC